MKNAPHCGAFIERRLSDYAPLAVQPLGEYSALTVVPHVHTPDVAPVSEPERLSVIVLPNTGPGALTSVQVIEPAPEEAVPVAANVQLDVVAAAPPATNVSVGSVP